MLIAYTEGLELLPDATETIWGVLPVLLIAVLVLAVACSVVWMIRAAADRRALGARAARREEGDTEHA